MPVHGLEPLANLSGGERTVLTQQNLWVEGADGAPQGVRRAVRAPHTLRVHSSEAPASDHPLTCSGVVRSCATPKQERKRMTAARNRGRWTARDKAASGAGARRAALHKSR